MTSSSGSSLSNLEIASGLVFGLERPRLRLPPGPTGTPAQALEDVIRPALRLPPCLVSFSGGRDSSLVLAAATNLARREQLPLPIPATNRFPAVEESDEREWQERVVEHLRLPDWIRLEFDDELDCVGPYATTALRRHGLLWPFNAHFHAPLLERARGGSFLTGVGGDEMLSNSSWTRAAHVLSGRARPVPRDVLRVGFALAPRPLRRPVIRRRAPEDVFSWLHEDVRRRLLRVWADEAATEPLRWRARCEWWLNVRSFRVGMDSVDRLAAAEDVAIRHPLASREFAAALAALPKRQRFAARPISTVELFGDLLPPEVLTRRSKASFDGAFWSTHSRNLVARWNGEGVDRDLVDVDALHRVWRSPEPDPRSFLQLQAVWLATAGGENSSSAGRQLEQPLAGGGE